MQKTCAVSETEKFDTETRQRHTGGRRCVHFFFRGYFNSARQQILHKFGFSEFSGFCFQLHRRGICRSVRHSACSRCCVASRRRRTSSLAPCFSPRVPPPPLSLSPPLPSLRSARPFCSVRSPSKLKRKPCRLPPVRCVRARAR